MNWEAIGVIAEVVGATAVVVSLVYLATQIRQTNSQVAEQVRALKLQAYDSSANTFSSFRLSIAASPQIASLWRRTKQSFVELSADEQAQVNELLVELFWAYENMLARRHEGAVDSRLWTIVEENIAAWLGNAGFREWWKIGDKAPHSKEFTAMVDRVCAAQFERDA